jgi:hypothetical protein
VLPYCCNSAWLASPPARGGNSVLSNALSLRRPAQVSTTTPLWEDGLSPPHHPPTHPPALSLCCFSCIHSLRVWLLAPPPFSRAGSVFHPNSTVSVRLQFAVYAFQLYCWWGAFSLPRSCTGLCSRVLGGQVTQCMLLTCSFCRFTQAALGRNDVPLFSGRLSMG